MCSIFKSEPYSHIDSSIPVKPGIAWGGNISAIDTNSEFRYLLVIQSEKLIFAVGGKNEEKPKKIDFQVEFKLWQQKWH